MSFVGDEPKIQSNGEADDQVKEIVDSAPKNDSLKELPAENNSESQNNIPSTDPVDPQEPEQSHPEDTENKEETQPEKVDEDKELSHQEEIQENQISEVEEHVSDSVEKNNTVEEESKEEPQAEKVEEDSEIPHEEEIQENQISEPISDSVEKSLSANSSTVTTERKDENPNPLESQPEIEQKSSMDQINEQSENIPQLAPAKKYSSVYMETEEHPLILIERHERDVTAKIGDQGNLDEKFIITNYMNNDTNPKEPHLTCSNLEVVTKNCFPADNDKLPLHGTEDWGQPKSISILPQKYIAIGTSKGFILVFNYLFTRIQKFGSAKEKEYGAVTSLDISVKEEDVVAIYESGKIVLWSMAKNERIKVIDPPEKGPSINVKFHKDSSEYFMLTTSSGSIYLYRVENIFFQWRVEKKLLSIPEEAEIKKDPYLTLPSGYFSVQILPKSQIKVPALSKHIIVAMASMKEIIVFTLEPTVVVLYRHKRPPGLRDIVTPCINWGRGSLPGVEDNLCPILAFSWGKEVYLLQLKKVDLRKDTTTTTTDDEERPDNEKVKLIGQYTANEDVILLQWVSQNTLATFNSFGEFNILYSGKFKDISSTRPYDFSQAITISIPLEDGIRFQFFNDSVNSTVPQNSVMFYEHTVSGQESERKVYLMGKKKMLTLKHLGWQEQLDNLVKKTAWLDAMALCVKIFNGENNALAEIPNHPEERRKALRTYAVTITKKYLDSVEEENKNAPMSLKNWAITIDTIIDFLIATDNYEYLFSNIPAELETFNIKELFLEAIEPFILKGRVKSLTNDAFKEIVRFFTEKGKMDTLQYLVINLSTKKIDMDYAIILCMQHNLLTALMYLCSHKEEPDGPDLLTPIASALGKYQRTIEEGEAAAEQYGLKFLWFVHMTLNGRLFPSGTLSQEQWEMKVKDIITLLFDETNIDLVLKINPYIAFELLEILFKPTTAALIRSYDENSIRLIGNLAKYESDAAESKEKLLMRNIYNFITSTQNKLQGQILGLIYHCSKKNPKYFDHLFYFLANLCIIEGCKLPLDVTEETMKYLLEHQYEPPAWKAHRASLRSKEDFDAKAEERSKLIVGLFKEVESFITSKELAELSELIAKVKLVDVSGHLYLVNKDFDGGFDFYLGQKNPIQKRKVLNWMKEIINRITEQEAEFEDPEKHIMDFYNFKESLINHLEPVVEINTEKARELIIRFDGSSDFEVEVVKKLGSQPTLQLDYLKQILATRDEYDPIANELLILYIDLLCQFSPKEVVHEIRHNNYPLDACLELFKKYNIKDAHALLLERTGQIKDALDIHLELFKESLDKQLEKIDNKFKYSSRSLTNKFETLLRSCTEHIKPDEDDAEENWQSVLDSILEYYEEVVSNLVTDEESSKKTKEDQLKLDCYEDLKKLYINYIAGFVEEMSKNVKIRLILKQLQSCKSMKLGELKDAFASMLHGHYTEMTILSKAEEQVSLDTNKNMTYLYTTKGEGYKVDPMRTLKTETNREDIVAFICGHAFPKYELIDGKICPICMESEISKVTALVLNSSKRGLSALKHSRSSPSRSVAGGTAKLDKTKSMPADRRKASEKRVNPWSLPENRQKCIVQLDRFEEWKDIDMFGWRETNENKIKKKDSFFSH